MRELVLASASPRRRELLASLGVPLQVLPTQADETLDPALPVTEALQAVARRKAGAAALGAPAAWVLGADTAVVADGEVFGKPRNRQDAERMLRRLAGREHRVVTAVALQRGTRTRSLAVTTRVRFTPLDEAQLRWYVGLDEPYDKAGAYAIQGRGGCLVAEIHGSYSNVVGLPLAETSALLADTGLLPWASPASREGQTDA